MKLRLSEEQVTDLAELLVERNFSLGRALEFLNIKGALDDTTHQTLETLVFSCVNCDTWRRLQDFSEGNVCSRCSLSREEEYLSSY
jgi:hypothetical protein